MPAIVSTSDIPPINTNVGKIRSVTEGEKAVKAAFLLQSGQAHKHDFPRPKKASAFATSVRSYIKNNGMESTVQCAQRLSSVYVSRV